MLCADGGLSFPRLGYFQIYALLLLLLSTLKSKQIIHLIPGIFTNAGLMKRQVPIRRSIPINSLVNPPTLENPPYPSSPSPLQDPEHPDESTQLSRPVNSAPLMNLTIPNKAPLLNIHSSPITSSILPLSNHPSTNSPSLNHPSLNPKHPVLLPEIVQHLPGANPQPSIQTSVNNTYPNSQQHPTFISSDHPSAGVSKIIEMLSPGNVVVGEKKIIAAPSSPPGSVSSSIYPNFNQG